MAQVESWGGEGLAVRNLNTKLVTAWIQNGTGPVLDQIWGWEQRRQGAGPISVSQSLCPGDVRRCSQQCCSTTQTGGTKQTLQTEAAGTAGWWEVLDR